MIQDADDIGIFCEKVNSVYKYLCYNYNINDIYVVKASEITDEIDFLRKLTTLYIQNTSVLKAQMMMECPPLPDDGKIDKQELTAVYNLFIKMLLDSKYNLMSLN